MIYEIVSSGSKGNCVIINDVMIDCGVSLKKIRNKLYDIKYLLLTHIHSDHIKPSTLKSIKSLFPKILIIGNYEIHQHFEVDIISNEDFEIDLHGFKVKPFKCVHNAVVQGFTFEIEDKQIIYATDTTTLEFAPKIKYDYFFIESNHDEKKLELARNTTKGYDPFKSGKRHLSTKQAKTFYYLNRRNKDSKLVELHKSERFY